MATQGWSDSASVKEQLFEHASRFEFFQAVRLLHAIWRARAAVGHDAEPGEEAVRFHSEIGLDFPRGDVSRIRPPERTDAPIDMTVAFMGVATPSSFGSLPKPYGELVRSEVLAKKFALRDFLDLFNHRLISLFYRAYEKYNLPLRYESGDEAGFARALFAVIGLETASVRERLALDDRALLARSGLLAMAPTPSCALEGLVRSYFEVDVEIVQFVPRRYEIAEEEQNRVGLANASLGEDLVVGSSVELSQFDFRIRLGPLTWKQYEEFLPIGTAFPALVDLARLATGQELEFEVQPILRCADVPPFLLAEDAERYPRLGWSTWLCSEDLGRDADDALLSHRLRVPESDFATPMEARS